ncbi:Protein of unknown function [Thermobacillus xylanilyticus]|nr:Protein of unknown function [Thermobacillus xylanilyticus]
MATGNL